MPSSIKYLNRSKVQKCGHFGQEIPWVRLPGAQLFEEIAYRGIMLGLLSNALRSKLYFRTINLGNPALVTTSVLFGLAHSFTIDHDWSIHQNWYPFFNTFLMGLLMGWITIKSGSIVMSILIHGLINTLPGIINLTKT